MHFIDGLVREGVEVHYLIPENGRPGGGSAPRAGIASYTYPNIFRSLSGLPGPAARLLIALIFPYKVAHRLKALAASIQPDLILGFSHQSIQPVSRVGREKRIPSAVKLFGVMHLGRKDLPAWKYYYYNFDQINSLRYPVDRYIVLNDGTLGREALIERGIPAGRITFLQNGMNLDWAGLEVDRLEARREFGLPQEDVLVVTLARFVKLKRVGDLIDIAARMDPAVLGKTSFVIAGDGPRKNHLIRKAARAGLKEKFIFTGAISYQSVPRLLKACDIFAGTGMLTNMSMPSCEAMLCGLPVVAYDVAGTAENVRDGVTGLPVEDSNTEEFAAKLERLISGAGLRESLGKEAALFAKEHFIDWEERVRMELEAIRLTAGESSRR